MNETSIFRLSFLEKQNEILKNDRRLVTIKFNKFLHAKTEVLKNKYLQEIITILDIPVDL
jgi:hypothetical protein